MHRKFLYLFLLAGWLLVGWQQPQATPPSPAVVRAVLFYSPTCPACQLVINETLPPLFEKYGKQFELYQANVTQTSGRDLFLEAIPMYNLRGSLPTLIIGDVILVGSHDIPEQLPGLIDRYLAQGSVDWPNIPGLDYLLMETQPTEATQPAPPTSEFPPTQYLLVETVYPEPIRPTDEPLQVVVPGVITSTPLPYILPSDLQANDLLAKLKRDPLGNAMAILVLVGMIFSCAFAVVAFQRPPSKPANRLSWGLIPLLCILGLGVAGYLAYVETSQVSAVCGPVGDCNAVQQSEYAQLFGMLPIGVLGIAGYLMILLTWFTAGNFGGRPAAYASLTLFGLAAGGVLFSIYLTFLEPFIIGATCAWCLTSAVIITSILWLSLSPAKEARLRLKAH